MTTTAWVIGAGAILVMLVLAGTIWAMRRGRAGRIETPEDAAAASEAALPGFVTAGAVVGADGAAALVVDGAGRVAVAKRRGARIAVSEVAWTAVQATPEGVLVDTGERSLGAILIAGIDALDVRRLAPHLTRA